MQLETSMTERPTVQHRIEYLGVRAVVAAVGLLPMGVVLAAGSLLGRAFYAFDGPHRRLAIGNLVASFPFRTQPECRAIAKNMF